MPSLGLPEFSLPEWGLPEFAVGWQAEPIDMTDPLGTPAVVKNALREMLAATTAFRAWDGASLTVDQAKERIYFDDLPIPAAGADQHAVAVMQSFRPFAVVYFPARGGVRWDCDASPRHLRPSGRIVIYLEAGIPDDLIPSGATVEDSGEIIRRFENWIGRMVSSTDNADATFQSLRATAGLLDYTAIDYSGPFRCHPDDVPSQGDHQYATLEIEWGARR